MKLYLERTMDDLTRHKLRMLLKNVGIYLSCGKYGELTKLEIPSRLCNSDFCIELQEKADITLMHNQGGLIASSMGWRSMQ